MIKKCFLIVSLFFLVEKGYTQPIEVNLSKDSITWDGMTNINFYQCLLVSTNSARTNLPNSFAIIKNQYILEHADTTNEVIKLNSFITNRFGDYYFVCRAIGDMNVYGTNNISDWSTNFHIRIILHPKTPTNVRLENSSQTSN